MQTLFHAEPIRENAVFSLPDWFVWCSCMVQTPDGTCHLFFSRWPKKKGFEAWVTHSEICHAEADSLNAPFHFRSSAFPGRGTPGSWDRDVTHNPAVLYENGKFYLYYMGNYGDGTYWDHRNHQNIGVAVADHPDGPWERCGQPLFQSPDAVMFSNPSVCKTPDGRFLMIYKWVAKKNPAPFHGPVMHGAAFADSPEGPFVPVRTNLFTTADHAAFPGEDPFVFTLDGRFCCLLKDNGTFFSDSSKALILFASPDGIRWEKLGIGLERTLRYASGKKAAFFRMERPQLSFCNDGVHLFCAVKPEEKKDESFSFHTKIRFRRDFAPGHGKALPHPTEYPNA